MVWTSVEEKIWVYEEQDAENRAANQRKRGRRKKRFMGVLSTEL